MTKVGINEEVCIGCGLCQVYCQVEHSRSKDLVKAFKKEGTKPLPRLRLEKKGEVSFALSCRHCAEPWCVYSCLTGAMYREPTTGNVMVDPERCIGCWTCILSCPYGVLTRDSGSQRVVKCDLCPGRAVPACVAGCPNEALLVTDGDARKV